MAYQNPNFDRKEYWQNRGTKKVKDTGKVVTQSPISIVDGNLVVENRAFRRRKSKGVKYSFFHKKGFYLERGAIKIVRKKNGVSKIKWFPINITGTEKIDVSKLDTASNK